MNPGAEVTGREVGHFAGLAGDWWDPQGPMRTLHHIGPARLAYVRERVGPLAGLPTLDVGCGAGLLAEGLAREGAIVTAIDPGEELIAVAKAHAREGGLSIDYRATTLGELPERDYALLTCMELLEHVPDPAGLLAQARDKLAPGGWLLLSTLNRTARAFWLAIVAAEYLTGLVPRGTHRHEQFLKPSELARVLRRLGFVDLDVRGLRYQPFARRAVLSDDPSVNYLMSARLP